MQKSCCALIFCLPLKLLNNSNFCCLFKPFQIPTGQNSRSCSRYNFWTMGVLSAAQRPQPANHQRALLAFLNAGKPQDSCTLVSCPVPGQSYEIPCKGRNYLCLHCLQIASAFLSIDIIFLNWYQKYKRDGALAWGESKQSQVISRRSCYVVLREGDSVPQWLQSKDSLSVTYSSCRVAGVLEFYLSLLCQTALREQR